MPELPDLQVFSKNLTKRLSGKKVKVITVPNSKKLNVTVKKLKESLEGKVLDNVLRVGKELHFQFKGGDVLALHLMLRGQLHVFEHKNDNRFTIIELLFVDDSGIAMTDYQGAATPTLNPDERDTVDALSDEMNFSFLKETLRKKKSVIKNVLLDQKVVRGIGNAYADEILWEAGISPFSISNKIPDDKIKALTKSIKGVLKSAEKNILKTHPEIISGEVRDFLNIHNSKKTQSPKGAAIKHKVVGARKTYYTDEQEMFE